MATTHTDPNLQTDQANTTAWAWLFAIIAVLLIVGAAYYYFHYSVNGTNPYVGAPVATGPGTTTTMAPANPAATTEPAPATGTPAGNP